MNTFRGHFPATKEKWKIYTATFVPLIFGSLLFALNGFVDNFMVGKYDGATALFAANSWTNIIKGILYGVGGAGSVVLAQLFFAKKYEAARDIVKIRYLLSFIIVAVFVVLAWTIPRELNGMFLKGDGDTYLADMDMAESYMRIIAFQWIVFTITFNLGSQLREIGHAKVVMIWGIGTLITNVVLNSIFMYGLDLGVEGAAWASVAGRFVALIWGTTYIRKHKLEIGFNPLTLLSFHMSSVMLIARRWFVIFFISTTVVFITFRSAIWASAFPEGSIGTGVGATAILAIAGTIYNVFIVTFNALTTMSAQFVGSELGKGNIKQAKINSNELKGYNTSMAFVLSVMMFIVALFVPNMNFLVDDLGHGKDIDLQLEQARLALFVIALYYPIWIWFSTSYRNGLAGGKGFWFTFTDWFITGPVQLSWLLILGYVIVPNTGVTFIWAYFLFYTSDFLKLFIKEYIYYRTNWARSITQEEVIVEKAEAAKLMSGRVDKPE